MAWPSATLANIFLCHYEREWLEQCPIDFKPTIYRRYVDDTFALFRSDFNPDSFLNFINTQHPNINFTVEKEKLKTLPFLDVQVFRDDVGFHTSIFRKNTFTGLGINFYSSCHFNFKLNSISTLLHRAFSLTSSWVAFDVEINFLLQFFKNNSFPVKYFYRTLNKFLQYKLHSPPLVYDVPKLVFYAKFPFIYNIKLRSKLINLLNRELPAVTFKLIPKNPLTIGSFFRYKDRLAPLLSSNIVYKYTCPKCELGTYVGCTKRLLQVRIRCHQGVSFRTGCRLSRPEVSNIRNHALHCKTNIHS